MDGAERTAAIGTAVVLVVGAVVALAGSSGSASVGSLPVFALAAILAFAINFVAFVPSFIARTEHYYDLVGALTHIAIITVALALSDNVDTRALIAAVLVFVWAGRLGLFLFNRVKKSGGDGRFDEIKQSAIRFFFAWSTQGLWSLLTLACALAIITAETREPFGVVGVIGLVVWLTGFAIEVVSDQQKSAFRADPANKGRFITTGLWAWSRHPNYFGEIVIWVGMAIMALPILSGWRFVCLISPVFVFILLTRISGIPMLESRAKKRWGDEEAFRAYKKNTPALMLRPPRT